MSTVLAEQAAKRTAEREAWSQRWPNHCQSCEGAGAFTVCGGTGDDPEYEGEPCEACQSRSCVCPRCGRADVSLFQPDPCPACGWTYAGPDAAMPSNEPIDRLECERAWEAGEFTDPFADE